LIDGIAYAMPPAFSFAHQTLVAYILTQFTTFLNGKPCRAIVAPIDVYFSDDEDGDTVVQPDVLVLCDPSKIRKSGIVGAPDVVVEVLSPSTTGRDFTRKRMLYEREGVAEYWIVSPEEETVYQYTLSGDGYSMREVSEGMLVSTRLQEFQLDVQAMFASLNGLPTD
jgi:Uma2 family endonuclease